MVQDHSLLIFTQYCDACLCENLIQQKPILAVGLFQQIMSRPVIYCQIALSPPPPLNNIRTRLLGRPQPQMYPPGALNQYTWVNITHKHFLYMLQGPMKILK